MESSEARFRATFDDAPTGIALVATDRRLLTVNRALCEMFGYPEDELVGRTLDHVTHPDDLGPDALAIDAMLAGESPTFQRVKRYRRRDGRTVHAQLWASLVTDRHGAPSHFVAHIQDITALQEATRDALEARRLLDESQHVAEVGSWSYALDTDELSWSDGQFRLHGVTPCPGPLTVEFFLGLLPVADRERIATGIAHHRTAREGFAAEYRVMHGDGSEHTLATRAEMLPADPATGLPARVSGITRDVTAERDAQRAQRVAEQRHVRLLASLPDTMVVLYDRSQRCMLAQGGLVAALGIVREEVEGRRLSEIAPPERLALIQPQIAAALRGESGSLELTIADRVLHVETAPCPDELGRITGALMVWRDITSRIREQAARREAEDRLRTTVDHAPIGVALVDLHDGAHGRLLSANAPFAALLGDPDPVAGGLSLTSVVHPEDTGALRADLTLLSCDEAARTETEVRCLRPDGSTVWIALYGAAVPAGPDMPSLAVVHALDIGERKRFEGRLQHLADHDPLTGLFNRRRFEAELARSASHVRRYRTAGALLLVDLDGFKQVNDTMGHSCGDELITRVAATLRSVVRETDIIGRLGGDEFAVVLASVTESEAVAVAEKILHAIEQHGIVMSLERQAGVTASVGIAPMRADGRLDAEELIAEADATMYVAKQSGRNRVALARPDGDAGLSARRSWQLRLRLALEEESFELHAQPIRGICAEDIERYELLLRMRGEDGELVAPSTFLPGAERYDLVQRIDRWVFGQALELLSAHEAAGRRIGLSVNMSGKTLCDPSLIDDLVAMVAACPIPRDRLIVEVTETAAIVNIERAQAVARTLRELGCHFALDDFGAGFASFYYLKHLDFDYVKIDGEFVKTLSTNATDKLVVRSVVELAQGLGAQTIAEFVGDDESIRHLRELGVDYGQGFHLGRPAPVTEILPTPIS